MRKALLRLHRFLLPDEVWIGWIPYLWLVYLSLPVSVVLRRGASRGALAATVAAVLVFVPLYFRIHWTRGREALLLIGLVVAIGLGLSPVNAGAGVFFIYASAFASRVGTKRQAYLVLAGVVGSTSLCALLPVPPATWISGAILSLLIGLVNIYYHEMGKKNEALRISQEEVKRLGALAERERIARDLHDLLGHTLTLIALKAELSSRLLARGDGRAAAEIDEVARISREALSEVRAAVAGYRSGGLPGELSNASLALEAVGVAFSTDGALPPLPPRTETVLALALREAVTNVIRHAEARRCEAGVRSDGEWVTLEVSDDGRGAGLTGLREGSGLLGMRERVTELGGALAVVSTGSGTRVTVRLPAAESGRARGAA